MVACLPLVSGEQLQCAYRRRMSPCIDLSGTWFYEGDTRLSRRDGLACELWGVRDFLDDRLSLGIGGGAYFAIDGRKPSVSRTISGIVTLTSSYRILPSWDARISWNRVITDHNYDTDVLLGGFGYRF